MKSGDMLFIKMCMRILVRQVSSIEACDLLNGNPYGRLIITFLNFICYMWCITHVDWSGWFDVLTLHSLVIHADVVLCLNTAAEQINTLKPRENCSHFTDYIFKCIFLDENIWISIDISLKFVPKGWFNNIPALVQVMADKPLSEPMMSSLTRLHLTLLHRRIITNPCFTQI